MADIAPPIQTETLTVGEATATWLSLLRASVTETVTIANPLTEYLDTIVVTATDSFDRIYDSRTSATSGALEAGVYDVTFGGGDAAVGRWALTRIGARPIRIGFYTPAGGSFIAQIRVQMNAGEALSLEGPNAGLLNYVRRWV